jgi:Ca2+-binding RTX toxin-like protein
VMSSTSSGVAWLSGGAGRDTLVGGPGKDQLEGGVGSDELSGGGGEDTVSYIGRNAPVTADLDGLDDDGEAGEGDLIRVDVENLVGGNAADVLAGSSGANVLSGSAGNDTLHGLAGDDVLEGSPGNDRLDGGPGPKWGPTGFTSDADVLDGGPDDDTADYSSRSLRLSIEIDGLANDGTNEPSLDLSEQDKVLSSVEAIEGGSGRDILIARIATLRHSLRGNGGDDNLTTGDGGFHDAVHGGPGSDSCSGDNLSAPSGLKDSATSCGSDDH